MVHNLFPWQAGWTVPGPFMGRIQLMTLIQCLGWGQRGPIQLCSRALIQQCRERRCGLAPTWPHGGKRESPSPNSVAEGQGEQLSPDSVVQGEGGMAHP